MTRAPDPRGPLELEAARMRELGYRAVDGVVARWAALRERPVTRLATRAEMEARLREPLPVEGEPIEGLLARFWADIEPFAGKIDHPRFFAFIPSSPTFAALLGDWLAAGCNFFQGTWIESAGPSQVELVVIDWLKEMLGFPASGSGLLTSGGSAASLIGLAAAREAKLDGLPDEGVAYGSDQTHTAVDRALRVLGLPAGRFRRLSTGASGRLDPAAVAAAAGRDRQSGLRPFCVVANAGTTSTGAVDPIEELADACAREDLWLHVDGAYGAFARLTTRGRRALGGLERADSLVLDPHKWLYVGYEAGCVLVRDGRDLERAFRVRPDYLQDVETAPGEVNFADLGLQLTRSARALKLWFSLKAHGTAAIGAAIDRALDLAELAERRIRAAPDLELVAPRGLGIVVFRWIGSPPRAPEEAERANAAAVRRIQAEGRFMLSSTRVAGRFAVRLCPLNYRTTEEDVIAAIDEVARAATLEAGGAA